MDFDYEPIEVDEQIAEICNRVYGQVFAATFTRLRAETHVAIVGRVERDGKVEPIEAKAPAYTVAVAAQMADNEAIRSVQEMAKLMKGRAARISESETLAFEDTIPGVAVKPAGRPS